MSKFLIGLLSGDESEVDSVIFFGGAAVIALILISIYIVVQDHTSFNPTSYAASTSGLIGVLAGGKRLRDGAKPPEPKA